MKTSDIINYKEFGFDGEKYLRVQKKAIEDRISKFDGRLYLEIGWKFLFDPHAARVLPGFFADSKKQIFLNLKDRIEIIFCINAKDLKENRQLSSEKISYGDFCIKMLQDIKVEIWVIPKVSINRISKENKSEILAYKDKLKAIWYESFLRYEIKWYPKDTEKVLSDSGYWTDEYIEINKDLVLVTGAASSSGKMSTCLWQIYSEQKKCINSWYAKYETFPIWNIPLNHPVNLAYEAATADIWDYNEMDHYHEKAYAMTSVNYNRDVEAFEIVKDLAEQFLPSDNFTRDYKSPTDMWINNAWFCITDDEIIKKAGLEEIDRRIEWYKEIIERWEGDEIWVKRCEELKNRI